MLSILKNEPARGVDREAILDEVYWRNEPRAHVQPTHHTSGPSTKSFCLPAVQVGVAARDSRIHYVVAPIVPRAAPISRWDGLGVPTLIES